MRRNRKPILTKVQDVMGIKSGKYCSSDVSVVSINGNGGRLPAHTLGNKPEPPINTIGIPSVTYINCPNREKVTIDFREIQMNNNIINDCVLGGSVKLNDLNGYVVNYGETICPVIKRISFCAGVGDEIVVNFGNINVTDGLTYFLTFGSSGELVPVSGCYTIIGDADPRQAISGNVLTSYQSGTDCQNCVPPPQNIKQIQSCSDSKIYTIDFGINNVFDGSVYQLLFNGGTQPGCYTIIKDDYNPSDTVSSVQGVPDCSMCRKVRSYTEIQSCGSGLIYSVNSNVAISIGGICLLTFNNGMTPNGCYTILGTTTNGPVDTIISTSDDYGSCENCKKNN